MTDDIWEYYGKEYQAAEARTWQPIRSGVPYTCQTCPALIEAQQLADKWRQIAERFANIDIHDQAALAFAYASFEELERAVQP